MIKISNEAQELLLSHYPQVVAAYYLNKKNPKRYAIYLRDVFGEGEINYIRCYDKLKKLELTDWVLENYYGHSAESILNRADVG